MSELDLLDWQDIPSWQTIVEDWHARMDSVGTPTEVVDLPVIGDSNLRLYQLDKPQGTWIPADTLSRIRVASWDKRSTLLRGEPYAFRNPETDFPYVPAGASDAAQLLAANPDRTSFAAVMIGMSAIATPQPSYDQQGAIWKIGQLALAHVRTLGMDERTLRGMNRRYWLPNHYIERDVETYEEAMANLAGEARAVLENYRPVRLVPFLKTEQGFAPADPDKIKQANDDFDRRAMDRISSFYDSVSPKRDWEARDTIFGRPEDEERFNTALAFFDRTVEAAGFSPDRYARSPYRIDLDVKAKGKTRLEVRLWRRSDICDEPGTDTGLRILINADGTERDDAATQVVAFVNAYEKALAKHQALLDKGIDPKAVHLDQIKLSPLARRVLELVKLTPGEDLTFNRQEHCDWAIIPWLELERFRYSVRFTVENDILYFDEIDIPCPIYGGLTIRLPKPSRKHGNVGFILVPRPLEKPPTGAPLHKVLSTPSLAGLPPISVSGFDNHSNRSVFIVDGDSPGLRPTESAATVQSPGA